MKKPMKLLTSLQDFSSQYLNNRIFLPSISPKQKTYNHLNRLLKNPWEESQQGLYTEVLTKLSTPKKDLILEMNPSSFPSYHVMKAFKREAQEKLQLQA